MVNSSERSSAEIQREIDGDRQKIEERIGEIQARMSPGQLVDEVLAYAKGGGGEYVSNLGKALKANPLPVALIGVSLAWLVAKQGNSAVSTSPSESHDVEYPLYRAHGDVRRVGVPEDIQGVRYSHFSDDAGQRFKALTDDAGNRAGHFLDASGKAYRGFTDATGKQVSQIRDEAGAFFDASSGWASETWKQIKSTASNLTQNVSDAAGTVSGSASKAGSNLIDQTNRLNGTILTHFRDQPLVGGALAFAIGAAIGAALPHTDTEDGVIGETADAVKAKVSSEATTLAEQGREIASETFDKAVSVATDVHDKAKERIVDEVTKLKDESRPQ